jgi:integrase/recombinase XerD
MNHKNEYQRFLFQFTEQLKVLNRSPATISAYLGHIKLFLDQEERALKVITRDDLERYIAGLYDHRMARGKGYSIGTISLKIRSLKRFFEYLEQSNNIFINPMEYICEPQKETTIPRRILSVQEIRKLLDGPNLGTRTGIRDRTVLEFLYSTGIRLGELCRLTIFDADLQGKMVRINQGKGRKDRVVPIGRHAIRFMREYITKIRPHFSKKNRKSRVLFINQLGSPLSQQVVSMMIRNCAEQAGLHKRGDKPNTKVTAHTMRHTFASQLVKNGADVTAVQKMLGHADLKTTQGYIRAMGVDLKKAHKKSHPREKDKVDRKSVKPSITRMRPEYGPRKS